MKRMKTKLLFSIFALACLFANAQSAGTSSGTSAKPNFIKILNCLEENRYADLVKPGTESKGVMSSIHSEPSVFPEGFSSGTAHKNDALGYWAVNYTASNLPSTEGRKIYTNLKSALNSWSFEETSEKTDIIDPEKAEEKTEVEELADYLYEMEYDDDLSERIEATEYHFTYKKDKMVIEFVLVESSKNSSISFSARR